jgi:hypothetical protein
VFTDVIWIVAAYAVARLLIVERLPEAADQRHLWPLVTAISHQRTTVTGHFA